MDTFDLAVIFLAVAVIGLAAHAWRFHTTRRLPLATLWLVVPLLGAMIALLLTPPSLVVVGLGGAAVLLVLLVLVSTIMALAVEQGPRSQPAEPPAASRHRAA